MQLASALHVTGLSYRMRHLVEHTPSEAAPVHVHDASFWHSMGLLTLVHAFLHTPVLSSLHALFDAHSD